MSTLQKRVYAGAFSLAALVVAAGIYMFSLPAVRQSALHFLGVQHAPSALALHSCLLDTKAQTEEVYFLSCGGIY